jgi:NADH-quinone oxidoreductase subunit L
MSAERVVSGSSFLQGVYGFLWHRWYLDAIYYKVFVNPVQGASVWGYHMIEQGFFDRLNGGVAGGARGLSSAGDWFDRHIVDGFVNGVGRVAGGFSSRLRKLQTGVAESYLFFILIGLILLLVLLTYYTGGVP